MAEAWAEGLGGMGGTGTSEKLDLMPKKLELRVDSWTRFMPARKDGFANTPLHLTTV